eukprot:gene23633-9162_t
MSGYGGTGIQGGGLVVVSIGDGGVEIAAIAIEVNGNFMFNPVKHPDFLGAIIGTG